MSPYCCVRKEEAVAGECMRHHDLSANMVVSLPFLYGPSVMGVVRVCVSLDSR